eukprot:11168454-Alexandrium_andersonii.AAC.1
MAGRGWRACQCGAGLALGASSRRPGRELWLAAAEGPTAAGHRPRAGDSRWRLFADSQGCPAR